MAHDVYRPSGYRDSNREPYDRGADDYNRRDDRYDGKHNDDHSHPYEWYRSRPYSRSPPRRRAPSQPRSGDMYRFGGDTRSNDTNNPNGHTEFSFRSGDQREFQNAPPPRREPPRGPRQQRGRDDRRFQGRQNFQPRRYGPKPAHERKILHADTEREGTPERLMGMAEGTSRFKQVNDLFVSDSESDSAMDLESPTLEDEPAVKRAKTIDDEANTEGKPKWCNPDPYYLVPPLDESREKRKDVVQLLRKAKLDAEKAATTASNAVTRNADFIGFGDEEDEEIAFDKPLEEGEIGSDRQGSRDSDAYPSTSLNGASANSAPANSVPATNGLPAPTASFSHRRNLHQMTDPTTAPAQGLAATPPIPQSTTTAAPDDALSEARALLHDLVAEDGVLPQKQKIDAAQHGKKRKLGADGEIARSWMAKDRASATPWYIDHSTTPSTTVWLHKEICDFHDFIKPRPYEARIRQDLIHRLQKALSSVFKGSKVFAFGSYGQDIYLPTSDMDLVLLSPEFQRTGYLGFNKRTLFRISGELQRQRITLQQDVTVISKAKVPIIKFVDILTGLNCDLSLDNDSGLKALTTFDKWRRTWPFLPQLLAVLKQWLLMRDINEVFNGGLGGFSITCMLVSMLQRMAPGQTTNLDGGANLGELLLDFFNLYGNKFNMDRTGISLIPSEYFPKAVYGIGKNDRWTIIDPNNPDNDLSGGSTQARLIQKKFADAHTTLKDTMRTLDSAGFVLRKGRSFLQLIVGGNYERVLLQRSVLRAVYEKNFGPVEASTRGTALG